MKIALIGSNGYVGQEIAKVYRSMDETLIEINRNDNLKENVDFADVVIHCANPSRRYEAEMNPLKDYKETIEKTFYILSSTKKKTIVPYFDNIV